MATGFWRNIRAGVGAGSIPIQFVGTIHFLFERLFQEITALREFRVGFFDNGSWESLPRPAVEHSDLFEPKEVKTSQQWVSEL